MKAVELLRKLIGQLNAPVKILDGYQFRVDLTDKFHITRVELRFANKNALDDKLQSLIIVSVDYEVGFCSNEMITEPTHLIALIENKAYVTCLTDLPLLQSSAEVEFAPNLTIESAEVRYYNPSEAQIEVSYLYELPFDNYEDFSAEMHFIRVPELDYLLHALKIAML